MTSKAKEFSQHLFAQIEEGRGITHMLPTPRRNRERGQWVREAAAGQRSTEWEEVEEDAPSVHGEINAAIRAGAGRPPDDEDS